MLSSRRRACLASAIAFVGLFGPNSMAGTYTWTGSGPDNFFGDQQNWSPQAVPGQSDSVVFNSAANVSAGSIDGLFVGGITNSGSLDLAGAFGVQNGTVTNTGTMMLSGTYGGGLDFVSSTLDNQGTIIVGSTSLLAHVNSIAGNGSVTLEGGELLSAGGTFTNSTNTIDGYGSISVGTGKLVNQATITADSAGGTLLIAAGSCMNSGTLLALSGSTLNDAAALTNTGTLHAAAGGTIALGGPTSGGSVTGGGTVTGGFNLANTTVAPGDLPAVPAMLTLSGGTTNFGSGGEYVWKTDSLPAASAIAGAGTDFDLLRLGKVTFSATPSQPFTIKLVSLSSSGVPGAISGVDSGQPYTWAIASFSSTNGTFNPAAFAFDTSAFPGINPSGVSISLDTTNDLIDLTVIPEPAASAAILLTASVFSQRRRRHRHAGGVVRCSSM
jgi:hypothetical protein